MDVIKPPEEELSSKITELQTMVSDLKVVFTSALLELSQIQHADTRLREELEQTRKGCDTRTCHLEERLHSLKEDVRELRLQMIQFSCHQQQLLQEGPACRGAALGRTCCVCHHPGVVPCICSANTKSCSLPSCVQPQHCGLKASAAGRLAEPAFGTMPPWGADVLQTCSRRGRRFQAGVDLLHSERQYVSTLNQLRVKYKTLSALPNGQESGQKLQIYSEHMLQRHLVFTRALQDHLEQGNWPGLVGEMFVKDTAAFRDLYLGYLQTLPTLFSAFSQSNGLMWNNQGCLEEVLQVFSLLAPVSRIHSYLIHIQTLLQWTRRDEPEHQALEERRGAMWHLLSQCHMILKDGVWSDRAAADCSDADMNSWSIRSHHSNVLRKSCPDQRGFPISPRSKPNPMRADTSDSSQSLPLRLRRDVPRDSYEDGDTDLDDVGNTSVFDYSSLTSCSPDGALELRGHVEEQEVKVTLSTELHQKAQDEEEDSQVPVLLKPSPTQVKARLDGVPTAMPVCLRWQVPKVPPEHRVGGTVRISPQHRYVRAFRPIWDAPSKQEDSSPSSEPGEQHTGMTAPDRLVSSRGLIRVTPRPPLVRASHGSSGPEEAETAWGVCEDADGPCSTV